MTPDQTGHIAYDDLREWLSKAEQLGEVRTVKGANWQEDIGLAAEAQDRRPDSLGRHHQCVPSVSLARSISGGERAHGGGHPQGAREVRLAAGQGVAGFARGKSWHRFARGMPGRTCGQGVIE